MLLPSLGTSIANVSLPTLAAYFAAPMQSVQWVVVGYLLAVTALIVSAGRLGDRFGRRRLLLGGIVWFTAASVAGSLAPTLGFLIAARILQGLGAAVMMALSIAIVSDTVAEAKTGGAMGLMGSMSAIGTALGPSLGGLLIAGPGWRAIFLINVPIGLAAWWLAARALPVERTTFRSPPARFDLAGSALLTVTLAAYALAMTLGRGHFGWVNVALLVVTAIGCSALIPVERRALDPVLRLALLRDAPRRAGLAMSVLVSTVIMTTLVVGPFYLAQGLHLDATQVGLILSVGPVVAALLGAPAGRLVDRCGVRGVTRGGLGAIAAGSIALSAVPTAFSTPGYVAAIIVITAGYALFQTANNTAIMQGATADQRGVVSGLLNLSRNLGLITGASVMGALFASRLGTGDLTTAPTADLIAGLRLTFATATGLIVLAFAADLGNDATPPPDGRRVPQG